jgi:hypothetical protein
MSTDEFMARIIGRLCQVAIESCDGGLCRVLNYESLNLDSIIKVGRFFGLELGRKPEELSKVLTTYSKDPNRSRPFVPDQLEKLNAVTEGVREACEKWARVPYARLRELERW